MEAYSGSPHDGLKLATNCRQEVRTYFNERALTRVHSVM